MNVQALPLWLRKFAVDFVETALALVFALTLAFPTTLQDGRAVAITIGGAILSALISAARRAIPGFLTWFASKMGTNGPDAVPQAGAPDPTDPPSGATSG